MKFEPGRFWALIGIASSTIGLVYFLDQAYPQWLVSERISQGVERVGMLWGLLPDAPLIGPFQLGHIVIGLIAVVLVLLIFFRPSSKEEKEIKEFRQEQEEFREEQNRFRAEVTQFRQEQRQSSKELGDLMLKIASQTSASMSFADAEIVNAPISDVWSLLEETNCGPTCQELLARVDVTTSQGDLVAWEGTGQVSGRDISVKGETRLEAPNRLTVTCNSGALRGFNSDFTLHEDGGATKVKVRAEFVPSLIPAEFSAITGELSTRVPEILAGNLAKLRQELETT